MIAIRTLLAILCLAGSAPAIAGPLPPGWREEADGRAGARLLSRAVAEGNHHVVMTVAAGDAPTVLAVKAEDRRLVLPPVRLAPGERAVLRFVVNVRGPALPPPPPNAPGGTRVALTADDEAGFSWDDRLTLEVIGAVAVVAIDVRPADVPTLYLAGDSTVTDQPREPAASWGQMLPALLDDGIAVANHARSGATLKSFATDLRLARLLSTIRAGDWLFIQFGHNDQKAQWPQTHADAVHAYPAWLRVYIAEARARGAHPVIVTSPERRRFADGRIVPSLADHAAAARAVAAAEGVPLIDLNALSRTLYEALGPTAAAGAFNDGGRDATHHNNYGAWLLANAVAAEVRRQVPALAAHVTAPPFDPARPPAAATVPLPESGRRTAVRPQGN